MIEKMYGAGIFYEDAANIVIPEAYAAAAKECAEEIVSQPQISVTQIEEGKAVHLHSRSSSEAGCNTWRLQGR